MAKQIWKFPIETGRRQIVLNIPFNSEILCVQTQHDIPCIWAVVDTTEERVESKQISVYATGESMSDSLQRYIGTYQLQGGILIYHVFEKISN